jgi:hypothetical protein
MERQVDYDDSAKFFLKDLFDVLMDKGYFAFPDNAKLYVEKLTRYAEKYLGILPDKDAPSYFNCYGNDLKYIIYKANKSTWWYIFYQQWDNRFLIRHITNNHVAAQYFDS